MDTSQMKNIVVLKNIPSNIVEEAIVVLKSNKKAKQLKYIEKNNSACKGIKKENSKDYIVREAELVISNYISNLESKKSMNVRNLNDMAKKYRRMKFLCILFGGIILFYTLLNIMPY